MASFKTYLTIEEADGGPFDQSALDNNILFFNKDFFSQKNLSEETEFIVVPMLTAAVEPRQYQWRHPSDEPTEIIL